MIEIKENELYQEIGLFDGCQKIGEAEVDLKGKMLSRLVIYEPYQNKGYGTEIVQTLKDKYGCDCLWVNADNDQAIHVYEKCGFSKTKPTMYLMELNESDQDAWELSEDVDVVEFVVYTWCDLEPYGGK